MLAKIEDAYLGVLRLAILIVAGLALLAAAGALVFGTIKGAQSISASSADAHGRSLGDFILEKRLATELSSLSTGSAPIREQPAAYSEAVRTAADTFANTSTAKLQTRLKRGNDHYFERALVVDPVGLPGSL